MLGGFEAVLFLSGLGADKLFEGQQGERLTGRGEGLGLIRLARGTIGENYSLALLEEAEAVELTLREPVKVEFED